MLLLKRLILWRVCLLQCYTMNIREKDKLLQETAADAKPQAFKVPVNVNLSDVMQDFETVRNYKIKVLKALKCARF